MIARAQRPAAALEGGDHGCGGVAIVVEKAAQVVDAVVSEVPGRGENRG